MKLISARNLTLCSLVAVAILAALAAGAAEPSYVEVVADTTTMAAEAQTFDAAGPVATASAGNYYQATPQFINDFAFPAAGRSEFAQVSVIIAVLLAGCAIPVAIVWLMLAYRLRIERLRCQTIEEALRRNSSLSSYIFSSHRRLMRSALGWIAVGIGTSLYCLMSSLQMFFLGLIPLLIGLAQMAAIGIERRSEKPVETPGESLLTTDDTND